MDGGRARRRRGVLIAVVALVALTAATAAIAAAMRGGDRPSAADRLRAAGAQGRAMVVFRSLGAGGAQPGQVVVAPPDAPPRAWTPAGLDCGRVYFAAGRGLCVARRGRAVVAEILGADLRVSRTLPLEGRPSRARVSPDGRYGAVTLFVTGHEYAEPGAFSTDTEILDLRRGTEIADLEDFTVLRGQRQVTAEDANFWGVTFARDSDRFYATMATGGRTYLIRGSVRARVARVVHRNVECPSLSPDGTRIAFKRLTASAARPWRLTVLDLATMRETPLAERRSVDDQAEWLDDGRVLYGAAGSVWVADADGGGRPRRFLAHADSPAVVRR